MPYTDRTFPFTIISCLFSAVKPFYNGGSCSFMRISCVRDNISLARYSIHSIDVSISSSPIVFRCHLANSMVFSESVLMSSNAFCTSSFMIIILSAFSALIQYRENSTVSRVRLWRTCFTLDAGPFFRYNGESEEQVILNSARQGAPTGEARSEQQQRSSSSERATAHTPKTAPHFANISILRKL